MGEGGGVGGRGGGRAGADCGGGGGCFNAGTFSTTCGITILTTSVICPWCCRLPQGKRRGRGRRGGGEVVLVAVV